jgi:hypothetical protein
MILKALNYQMREISNYFQFREYLNSGKCSIVLSIEVLTNCMIFIFFDSFMIMGVKLASEHTTKPFKNA